MTAPPAWYCSQWKARGYLLEAFLIPNLLLRPLPAPDLLRSMPGSTVVRQISATTTPQSPDQQSQNVSPIVGCLVL